MWCLPRTVWLQSTCYYPVAGCMFTVFALFQDCPDLRCSTIDAEEINGEEKGGKGSSYLFESLEHYARHKTYTTHLVLVQSYENLIIISIFHKVGSFRNKLPKVIPTSPCRTSSASQFSWPILIIQCYLLRRKETANHAFESVFSLLRKHSKKLKGRKIHVFNKILVDLNNEHSTCCSMTINK